MPTRPAAKRSAPRTRYHHGDLRQALLAAAHQLLEQGGSGALTLRAAAQSAGVSAAAPYRHFADREALLAAALREGFEDMAQALRAAREAGSDPVDAYLAVGRAYLAFAAAHPRLYSVMFSAEFERVLYPELLDAGRAAFGEVLTAANALGDARLIGTRSAEDVALAGWTTVHGLASVQIDGLLAQVLPVDPAQAAERLFSILIEGIAPRP